MHETSELQKFYGELDENIPPEQKMFCNGREVILSTVVHGVPFTPEMSTEWLERAQYSRRLKELKEKS